MGGFVKDKTSGERFVERRACRKNTDVRKQACSAAFKRLGNAKDVVGFCGSCGRADDLRHIVQNGRNGDFFICDGQCEHGRSNHNRADVLTRAVQFNVQKRVFQSVGRAFVGFVEFYLNDIFNGQIFEVNPRFGDKHTFRVHSCADVVGVRAEKIFVVNLMRVLNHCVFEFFVHNDSLLKTAGGKNRPQVLTIISFWVFRNCVEVRACLVLLRERKLCQSVQARRR